MVYVKYQLTQRYKSARLNTENMQKRMNIHTLGVFSPKHQERMDNMALKFVKCGPEVPAGCEEIFYHSEIYERYFQGGKLERTLTRAAAAGELYLVLDESGRPVGALKLSMRGFCGLYPYLGLLGVHPESRGLGVGAFIIEEVAKMARESGAKRITLMVSDFNTSAMRFYKRLGFWEMGRFPAAVLPDVAEVLLVKDVM